MYRQSVDRSPNKFMQTRKRLILKEKKSTEVDDKTTVGQAITKKQPGVAYIYSETRAQCR